MTHGSTHKTFDICFSEMRMEMKRKCLRLVISCMLKKCESESLAHYP